MAGPATTQVKVERAEEDSESSEEESDSEDEAPVAKTPAQVGSREGRLHSLTLNCPRQPVSSMRGSTKDGTELQP